MTRPETFIEGMTLMAHYKKDKPRNRRKWQTTLDVEIIERATIRCVQERVNVNDVLEYLLQQWLSNKIQVPTEKLAR